MSPHYYISLFASTLGVWDRLWEALITEAWTKDDVARPYRSSLIAYYYSGMEGANTHAISKGTLLPYSARTIRAQCSSPAICSSIHPIPRFPTSLSLDLLHQHEISPVEWNWEHYIWERAASSPKLANFSSPLVIREVFLWPSMAHERTNKRES